MTTRDTRRRATTTSLAVLALVAGLAWPAAAAPGAPTQPTDECDEDQSGTHPGVECRLPGDPGDPGDPDNPGGPGGPSGPGIDAEAECAAQFPDWDDCVAVVNANGMHPGDICGYVVHPDQSQLDYYHPDRPEGYDTLLYNICPRDGLYYSEDTQAAPGGVAAPLPDPEDVAAGVWARVQTELPGPALETWPPQGVSSVVNTPTFVAVTNWADEVEERGCDTGVCIVLTATRTALTFDPGERPEDDPENWSSPVACEPGGTPFHRNGGDPFDQAEGDACAHSYTHVTGVHGRSSNWAGEVGITWTAQWVEVGGAGEEGVFDPVVVPAALPRAVTEYISVVTGVTPAGRG